MKVLVDLRSNCDFWQPSEDHIRNIRESCPNVDIELSSIPLEDDPGQLKGISVLISWRFSEKWMQFCSDLRLIITPASGTDNFPVQFLKDNAIHLVKGTGFHGIPMAQHAMAMLLMFSRGMAISLKCQQTEEWWKSQVQQNFFDIYGETMAIVGFGNVGEHLAKIALAAGMKVLGFRRHVKPSPSGATILSLTELEEYFPSCKVIVNLLPNSENTKYFFNKSKFSLLMRGSVFISLGRGETVNESDLEFALREGYIGYCGLDVFETKPPKLDWSLRHMNNVILTPKTGVFFNQYFDMASKFISTVLSSYMSLLSNIGSSYVQRDSLYLATKRFLSTSRIAASINPELKQVFERMSKQELIKELHDQNRNTPYLALTINSLCNRNCIFCGPMNANDRDELKPIDYYNLARESSTWGIRKIHISGGEPTLRTDLEQIVSSIKSGFQENDCYIGLTTNGSLSIDRLEELVHCGLSGINISLHSLDEHNFRVIFGGGSLNETLNLIERSIALGLKVKVNCTLLRSYKEDAISVMELAKKLPITVRLIELQAVGAATEIFEKEFISETEFLSLATSRLCIYHSEDVSRANVGVRAPGDYFRPEGWLGCIGFISNTSRPVCADGNRIKITPTGGIRACTLPSSDSDIRDAISKGNLEEPFRKIFARIAGRNHDPEHRGYHYIDYQLRWNLVNSNS